MAAAISPPAPSMPSTSLPPTTAAMAAERPKKRQKLAEDAQVELLTRETRDVETSLEVDHMILDYLLYQAIEACLVHPHSSWDDNVSPVEHNLLQVDQFYTLFRRRYPNYKLDAQIQFRCDLVQFAALFSQRLRRNSSTPSLESLKRLKEFNRVRAYCWIGDAYRQPTRKFDCQILDASLPLEREVLDQNRARVLKELGIPAEDDAYEDSFYGTSESASLLDLLPLFMKVSAACFAIFDVGLTSQWIAMAIALMTQATVEQYLVYGEDGSDPIDEAFAWGYKKPEDSKDDTENDTKINSMFEDEEHAREVPTWRSARNAALNLLGQVGKKPVRRFEKLHDAQSITACEKNIMTFLKDISKGMSKPVLLQLEEGCLEGMSPQETQAFVQACGVDVEGFLGQLA